jgi:hypothetical protein
MKQLGWSNASPNFNMKSMNAISQRMQAMYQQQQSQMGGGQQQSHMGASRQQMNNPQAMWQNWGNNMSSQM